MSGESTSVINYEWKGKIQLGHRFFCILLSVKLPIKDPIRVDLKQYTSTHEMILRLAGLVGCNKLYFWDLPTRIFNFSNRLLYGVYIML